MFIAAAQVVFQPRALCCMSSSVSPLPFFALSSCLILNNSRNVKKSILEKRQQLPGTSGNGADESVESEPNRLSAWCMTSDNSLRVCHYTRIVLHTCSPIWFIDDIKIIDCNGFNIYFCLVWWVKSLLPQTNSNGTKLRMWPSLQSPHRTKSIIL